jgi:hypothetical protein
VPALWPRAAARDVLDYYAEHSPRFSDEMFAAVFSIPVGIDCTTAGGTCSSAFLSGTVVQLVAVTQPGTLLERLVGCTRDNPDGNPATNECEVNMVDDRFIQVRLLRP